MEVSIVSRKFEGEDFGSSPTKSGGGGMPPLSPMPLPPPKFQQHCSCGLDKTDNSSSRSTELTTVLGLNEERKNNLIAL